MSVGKEGYGSSWLVAVLFTVLAFFVYGQNISLMLGFLLLGVLSSLVLLVALVPFGGGFLLAGCLKLLVFPWVFSFTGLYETWLTSLLFWFNTIIGFMLSILFTVVLLMMWLRRD